MNARRPLRGRCDDGQSFLNTALRPMWSPPRMALRRLLLGWLTGWCQRDNKQMESDLIGLELFMALRSGDQLICLPRKGAWLLNNRSSSAAGGTELLTWWIGDCLVYFYFIFNLKWIAFSTQAWMLYFKKNSATFLSYLLPQKTSRNGNKLAVVAMEQVSHVASERFLRNCLFNTKIFSFKTRLLLPGRNI